MAKATKLIYITAKTQALNININIFRGKYIKELANSRSKIKIVIE